MPNFILTYRYPHDYNALLDRESFPAWHSFLEKIAEHVVDPGWPVFEPPTMVGASDSTTKLAGYSVVDVDDLETAVALAKSGATLTRGGAVEVGSLAALPSEHPAEVIRSSLIRP
jgi:hypothetical protein